VILKLSGECLAGEKGFGIDFPVIEAICKIIEKCMKKVRLGVVVGGGNFWRGRNSGPMNCVKADKIGMMATVMNALALADTLERIDVPCAAMAASAMPSVIESYSVEKALSYFKNGRCLIFACGTGGPFFSTDTAAAIRAAELGANLLLKATLTDGVYDEDPAKNPGAKKFERITFMEILQKDLRVIDAAAAVICRENNIMARIFNARETDNIYKAISENIGTLCN
jgi:uridylate kinase